MRTSTLLALTLISALPLAGKEMSLDDLTVGQTVLGPKLSKSDLKGFDFMYQYVSIRIKVFVVQIEPDSY